jgi:hypothetical protein
LPAILTDLEGLRRADFAALLFAVEFDQSIAVTIRIPGVAPGKISANLLAAPLTPGLAFRIESGVTVRASFVDL